MGNAALFGFTVLGAILIISLVGAPGQGTVNLIIDTNQSSVNLSTVSANLIAYTGGPQWVDIETSEGTTSAYAGPVALRGLAMAYIGDYDSDSDSFDVSLKVPRNDILFYGTEVYRGTGAHISDFNGFNITVTHNANATTIMGLGNSFSFTGDAYLPFEGYSLYIIETSGIIVIKMVGTDSLLAGRDIPIGVSEI